MIIIICRPHEVPARISPFDDVHSNDFKYTHLHGFPISGLNVPSIWRQTQCIAASLLAVLSKDTHQTDKGGWSKLFITTIITSCGSEWPNFALQWYDALFYPAFFPWRPSPYIHAQWNNLRLEIGAPARWTLQEEHRISRAGGKISNGSVHVIIF